MSWEERSLMSLRSEFVSLAMSEGANVRASCRRFGISAKTGYKWIARYRATGEAGLSNRSRRPRSSPRETSAELAELVVSLRGKHPAWGGRKLKRRLEDLGHAEVPSANTITEILRRSGPLDGPGANEPQFAWEAWTCGKRARANATP